MTGPSRLESLHIASGKGHCLAIFTWELNALLCIRSCRLRDCQQPGRGVLKL